MKLQVEFQDLRRMLKEKCEEIISDKKLAYEFYCRVCEIEEDERFVVVKGQPKQEAKPMTEYDDGWNCPRCGLKLIGKTASGYPCDVLDLPNDEIVKYCPVCGQAVKWDETD